MRNAVRIFLSANFDEFSRVRNQLCVNLPRVLQGRAVIDDLQDSFPRTKPAPEESLRRAEEADLCVVLIGDRYGGKPPGRPELLPPRVRSRR